MAIIDLFSKRQKVLRGEVVDVYFYDKIPHTLRVQIIHIIRDAIGIDRMANFYSNNNPYAPYKWIHESLCREYGVFTLGTSNYGSETDEECVLNYLLKTDTVDQAIDIIEISFKVIKKVIGEKLNHYKQFFETKIDPIEELNGRFKEHGFGYQFEGEMIRIDSTYIHSEITKPTLSLLNQKEFAGPDEEYRKAHEHYKNERNKECLSECLKAFESTLKVICTKKGWTYNQTDTSKKLIQIVFQNNLVPAFTQNQFTSLQNLLESGIPTIRNKLGGHGQGQILQKVDDEMTRYALNLTGSNIIFLIEQSVIQ
jgi:hypothetical protein